MQVNPPIFFHWAVATIGIMIVLQSKSWQSKKRGSSKPKKIKSSENGFNVWAHFYKQGNLLFSNTHVSHTYKKNTDSRNMDYCFSNTSCIKSVEDSVEDSGTHLWISVWTDRLGVSSCVSISRVRLGLALWLLQHLGNRRPDGGGICRRLRWHNRNAHWLIPRKQSCYSGGATKCFGWESNTKPANTTELPQKREQKYSLVWLIEVENVHAVYSESTFRNVWSGGWAEMCQDTRVERTSLDPKMWTHIDLHVDKIKRLFEALFLLPQSKQPML